MLISSIKTICSNNFTNYLYLGKNKIVTTNIKVRSNDFTR
ncbi:hypothetical protein OSCI_3220004 [Kamptonema sp. PCC 6506]|nr:hypothetical protein OSCI_3220004 [Kamptonema sp. PCC 6506]